MEEQIEIAQLGKTVGLEGFVRINLHTDFPEQFKKGAKFTVGEELLVVDKFDEKRMAIKFIGYASIEASKVLINRFIYTTMDATKQQCKLGEGEYFWFDIIGCSVFENNELLGTVEDIDRIGPSDFLFIKTSDKLISIGMSKQFLIPYQDRFVICVDTTGKSIKVANAKDILEAS